MRPYHRRQPGHRPHLPERRPVQGHVDARQHHDRAHAQDAPRHPRPGHLLGRRRSARRSATAQVGRADHRLPRDQAHPQDAGRQAALRAAEARRARPRARHGAGAAAARRADGRHEPGGEAGHEPLHPHGQGHLRHHHRADRARHGRGDGPVRPRGGARLRPQDRRRNARPKCRETRRSSTPIWAFPTRGVLRGPVRSGAGSPDRRPAVGRALLAGGARLRADLQGLRRLQFRARRHGAAGRPGAGALARLPGRQGRADVGRGGARAAVRRRHHGASPPG